MLRGDNFEEDTGCQAVFPGTSRISDDSGKSSGHSVPVHLQQLEKQAMQSQLRHHVTLNELELSETGRTTIWARLPRNRRPVNFDEIDDTQVPWKAICTATRGQDECGKAHWKNYYSKIIGKKLGMLIFPFGSTLFLSVFVDDIKMVGRRKLSSDGRRSNLMIHPAGRSDIQDAIFRAATVDEETIRKKNRNGSNNSQVTGFKKVSSWSYDMNGHAERCVERHCEFHLKQAWTPCIEGHPSFGERWFRRSWGIGYVSVHQIVFEMHLCRQKKVGLTYVGQLTHSQE